MDEASDKRAKRVAERVRHELMTMLLRGEVREPAVADVYVTHVQVTDDLHHARIFVRKTGSDATEPEQKRLVRALGRASGFLRRELGSRLGLRYTPEIVFAWDAHVDEARHIAKLIDEIAAGRGGAT